jgi:hypothetical protein
VLNSIGHWIHDCPTNNDPSYDKKRLRRTTGIPRSMLESVEKPMEGSGPLAQGVMVTPDGGYVIARPDLWVSYPVFYKTPYSNNFVEHHGKNNEQDQRP